MSEPVLDAQTLNESVQGDRDLLVDVIASFKEDGVVQLRRLAAAIEHSNASELRQAGHRLKGAATSIGLTRLTAVVAEVEAAGVRGEPALAAGLMERLRQEFDAGCHALDAYIARGG